MNSRLFALVTDDYNQNTRNLYYFIPKSRIYCFENWFVVQTELADNVKFPICIIDANEWTRWYCIWDTCRYLQLINFETKSVYV